MKLRDIVWSGVALFFVACGSSGSSGSQFSANNSGVTNSPPVAPNFQSLEISNVDRGDISNLVSLSSNNVVITDDMAWINLWQSHRNTTPPVIDFGANVVVGRFLQEFSTGGFSTEIVSVVQDLNSGQLVTTYRDVAPTPGSAQASVITRPFHIVTAAFRTPVTTMTVRQQSELTFSRVSSGSNSNIGANNPNTPASLHVARNQTELDDFWNLHSPGSTPPSFDFSTSMMIAVLGAANPNFGNSVRTKRIVQDSSTNSIRIIFEVDPYRGGAAPPQIFTPETPFQILRVAQVSGNVRNEVLTNATIQRVSEGSNSLYTGSRELLIVRDSSTFSNLWTQRVGGPIPTIDFTTEQAVCFFNGVSSSSVSSTIRRIELSEDNEYLTEVNTNSFGGGNSSYSIVTTTRGAGAARLEVIDVTPRP